MLSVATPSATVTDNEFMFQGPPLTAPARHPRLIMSNGRKPPYDHAPCLEWLQQGARTCSIPETPGMSPGPCRGPCIAAELSMGETSPPRSARFDRVIHVLDH